MQNQKTHKKNFSIILTLILLILIIPFSLAEIVPVNTNNQAIITNDQINQQIVQQGTQTRNEITTYIDKKVAETISTLTTDGQAFINENFKAFDRQMRAFALKVLIQLIIGIVVSIVFANALWYMIKKALDKKEADRPRYLILDTLTAKNYGLISEEYKAKIDKERDTIIKSPVFEETKNNPEAPTLTEIEEMMKQADELKKGTSIKDLPKHVQKVTEPKKGFLEKIKEKNLQKKKDSLQKKKMIEQKKAKQELEKIEEAEKKEKEKLEKKKAELKKKIEEEKPLKVDDMELI